MAVVNKYTDPDILAGKSSARAWVSGAGTQTRSLLVVAAVAAADDDGSVYRIAKSVPADMILINAEVVNDAIAGGTSYDLGLYKPDAGAVINKNCFMSAQTMASARANGSALSGIAAQPIADNQKRLFEIAGDTVANKPNSYDICLTANTVGTASGNVVVRLSFAQG